MSSPLTLSNIDINFETVKDKLVTYLKTQDSWQNVLTSSTGGVLLDIAAYLGSSDKFAIEAALREAYPDTARSDKSILAMAKAFWGNHILRKSPAKITVDLSNTANYAITIPHYSQFNISTLDFFNRSPVTIVGNSTASVTLYQGTVTTETEAFQGTKNEKVYLGNSSSGFVISDHDIFCEVGSDIYTKTTTSIFETGPTSAAVFYENTLPTGEVEVSFGDGLYGKLPSSTDILTFTYIVTLGAAGNGMVNIGEQIVYNNNANIAGTTTSASIEGGDELPAEFYRVNGSALRSAAVRGGGVTRTEYRAIGLQFPSIVDCVFLGQAETFPGDKNYMNVLTAVLLASPPLSPTQFQDFASFMQASTIDGLEFIQQNATPVNSNIVVNIYCTAKADPNAIQNQVTIALNNLKPLKAGMMGYSYYKSDLINIIKFAAGGYDFIDYIVLTTPSVDLVVEKYQYVAFNTITVNSFYSDRGILNIQ